MSFDKSGRGTASGRGKTSTKIYVDFERIMSRIYDNKPLRNVPVNNVSWPSVWDHDTFKKGNGLLAEAVIKQRSRFCLTDSKQNKFRYFVFHVELKKVHRRQFDSSGKEVEPNFSETQKISTGYLASSYKVESKGETDLVNNKEAEQLLTVSGLTFITASYCPPKAISLWIEESALQNIELDINDEVRVKTEGNSPFIFKIAKLDTQSSSVSNYAGGEGVGETWTDKIMSIKGELSSSGAAPVTGDNEGAGDDEWDD